MKISSSILAAAQSILLALTLLLFSCNQNDAELKAESEQELTADTTQLAADTVKLRPAPAFFVIPEELDKQRVWICDGSNTDVFHLKNDCPELASCKGKGTFRNLSIHRAIEAFGRYNCTVCSKELSHIFDEELVR